MNDKLVLPTDPASGELFVDEYTNIAKIVFNATLSGIRFMRLTFYSFYSC